MEDEPVILFAATKDDWRNPSKSQWVWDCLEGINMFLIDHPKFEIVSIPALGCGLGRLAWNNVRQRMSTTFFNTTKNNPDLTILAFEPAIR